MILFTSFIVTLAIFVVGATLYQVVDDYIRHNLKR